MIKTEQVQDILNSITDRELVAWLADATTESIMKDVMDIIVNMQDNPELSIHKLAYFGVAVGALKKALEATLDRRY